MSWKWEPGYNRVTRIDNGGCSVRVVDKVFGSTDEEWCRFGRMIALAPRMADFVNMVAAYATVETNQAILNEADAILRELRGEK